MAEDRLTIEQLGAIHKISNQLSEVAVTFKEQLLQYESSMDMCNGSTITIESCKMLDLLMCTELVIFSLHAHETLTLHSEDIEEADSSMLQPVPSIQMAEDLLVKFDKMVISQKSNTENQNLA